MAWVYLLIAGCLEVIGVILMNEWSRTKHKIFILLIGIAFICSFSTLKLSMIDIPMGTAYAIWTGIGTAGGTIIGMIFIMNQKYHASPLYSTYTRISHWITFNQLIYYSSNMFIHCLVYYLYIYC